MNRHIRHKCVCAWIGYGEGCRQPTLLGKSYCEEHNNRVYSTMPKEMAIFIIEKDINEHSSNSRRTEF